MLAPFETPNASHRRGRPCSKAANQQKTLNARNSKLISQQTTIAKENLSTTPAIASKRVPKRPRSNSESLYVEIKRRKAQDQTIIRRDKALKKEREARVQLQSDLTFEQSKSNTAINENHGIMARLMAASSGLETLDQQHTIVCAKLESARTQLAARDRPIEQLERKIATTANTYFSLQERINELTKLVRKYEARERRASLRGGQASSCKPFVFSLRQGKQAKGAIPISVRLAILELTVAGVASAHVFRVILTCAELFGVETRGMFSEASVCTIILEAGVAGQLQIADAMIKSPSMYITISDSHILNQQTAATLSSDSTSHKSVSYLAQHVTVLVPDTPEQNGLEAHSRTFSATFKPMKPVFLAFPITTLDDHSSKGQLDRIIESIRTVLQT
jgi:hypothetical protein